MTPERGAGGAQPSAAWVRHCTGCGRLDLSERYTSPEQGNANGVWDRFWACQECGHLEFEIVENTTTPDLNGGLRPVTEE